jgi:pectinacetylesterase
MSHRLPLVPVLLALTLTALTPARRAAAVPPYPGNACVSAKQREAARYCRAVLRAWSRWNANQDDGQRDATLQRVAAKLDLQWAQADGESLARGTDCADTTLSRASAQDIVDQATTGIVTAINSGLDLGNAAEARCGAKLLTVAAAKCAGLLQAESKHIRRLERDPDAAVRDALQLRARARFSRKWGKVLAHGCPTLADRSDVESRIDTISADIVRNTIVSPNVDDTQFTTYSPTDSIHYQGRTFTPICMNGSPYHFFAKRGSVNRLLVYYQGGGACWEQLTCSLPACDTTVNPNGSDNPNNVSGGFADGNNPSNPFRDWNVVFVAYCSCDVHFGDAAQDYPLHVEHRGYENSRVVEKWAREHFLDPELVFVTGSSAGAYGAWFNAPLHEGVWPASKFRVLADAGNGVITQSFLDNEFPHWNFAANIPNDIPGLADVLVNGTGIVGYTEVITKFFPTTRWAHYATAFDGGFGGQTGFYNIMLHDNNPVAALSWWEGSCAFHEKMREQALATAAAVPSNYRYYIGTGSRHTMWGSNKVYTDTTGGVPLLVDWVNAMIDGTPAWTNVECTNCGLTLPGDPAPNPLQPPFEMVGPNIVINCPSSPSGAFVDGTE